MLSSGALRLLERYAVSPGSRAVLATTNDRGLEAAARLHDAGVAIVAVADLRDRSPERAATALGRAGDRACCSGHTILAAKGAKQVSQAVLASLASAGPELTFACDLVVVSGGFAPATSLLLQAGATTRYDAVRGCFVLDELPPGVSAVGDVAGVEESDVDGAVAPPPVAGARHGKCFACLCEDVTAKDIELSIDEGYDSIELAKRYTTVTMGPCQGRMCQLASVRLMAAAHRAEPAARRDHDRAAALHLGAHGRPGRPPVPAGQALVDPRAPPRAGGQREVGRRLATRVRLRRPAGRGARGSPGRRPDRRLDARQAARARTAGRRVPRPPVPEPVQRPGARADPLRGDQLRRRPDRRRRHGLPGSTRTPTT